MSQKATVWSCKTPSTLKWSKGHQKCEMWGFVEVTVQSLKDLINLSTLLKSLTKMKPGNLCHRWLRSLANSNHYTYPSHHFACKSKCSSIEPAESTEFCPPVALCTLSHLHSLTWSLDTDTKVWAPKVILMDSCQMAKFLTMMKPTTHRYRVSGRTGIARNVVAYMVGSRKRLACRECRLKRMICKILFCWMRAISFLHKWGQRRWKGQSIFCCFFNPWILKQTFTIKKILSRLQSNVSMYVCTRDTSSKVSWLVIHKKKGRFIHIQPLPQEKDYSLTLCACVCVCVCECECVCACAHCVRACVLCVSVCEREKQKELTHGGLGVGGGGLDN